METRPDLFELLSSRASVRSYLDEPVPNELIRRIVAQGQRAPFSAQTTSIVLTRQHQYIPWGAPLFLIFCLDHHRQDRIMARKGWKMKSHPLWQLILGIEDAALCAACVDLAAQAEGLGTCFIGGLPEEAESLRSLHRMPPKVFPLFGLCVGYPKEVPPPRPRYPVKAVLHDEIYSLTDEELEEAMSTMDQGYLAQEYYRKLNAMVPPPDGSPETLSFETYSWCEHIARKWAQYHADIGNIVTALQDAGFDLYQK